MAVYWILTLCMSIWVTRGITSSPCSNENFKSNPSNASSYFQCSNGEWILMPCAATTEWHQDTEKCANPTIKDTTNTIDTARRTTSVTSTLTPTVAIDTVTSCQNNNTGIMCPCLSPNMKYVNITQEVLEKLLQDLKKELTLKKTLLAKSIRRKISAKDSRLSSQLMGYTGAIMLATPILIIVLSDAANLIRSLSVKKQRRNGSTNPA